MLTSALYRVAVLLYGVLFVSFARLSLSEQRAEVPQNAANISKKDSSTLATTCAWEVDTSSFAETRFSGDSSCSLILIYHKLVTTNKRTHHLHRGRGALVIVTDSLDKITYNGTYFYGFLMKLMYCLLNNYQLYVYHGHEKLPEFFPPHFLKIPAIRAVLRLGHAWCLYSDLDMFMIPESAFPIDSIATHPITIQKEFNLCSCVLLFTDNIASYDFLQQWWEAGFSKCCTHHTYEQIAFKHVLGRWLQNYTNITVYDANISLELALGKEPSTGGLFQEVVSPCIKFYGSHSTIRTATSAALLKIPVPQLHSCLNLWGGCVDGTLPSLFYHTGHERWGRINESFILEIIERWKVVLFDAAA